MSRVFRNFALPVECFDHLKDVQRHYRARHGIELTNNDTLALIFMEHREHINAAREGRDNEQSSTKQQAAGRR